MAHSTPGVPSEVAETKCWMGRFFNDDQEVLPEVCVNGDQVAQTRDVYHAHLLSILPLEHSVNTAFKLLNSVECVDLCEYKCQTIQNMSLAVNAL